MKSHYERKMGIREDLRFPPDLRTRQPMAISFQGEEHSGSLRHTYVVVRFQDSSEMIDISVTAEPSDRRPIETLQEYEVRPAAELAGRIRFWSLPYSLQHFNKHIRDVFVPEGRRPFWKYNLGPQGEWVPVSYQPHGPWKLEPQRDPFDLTTSVSLALPRRFVHDRPLVDLVEELYNTNRPRPIPQQPTVSVDLDPEKQG